MRHSLLNTTFVIRRGKRAIAIRNLTNEQAERFNIPDWIAKVISRKLPGHYPIDYDQHELPEGVGVRIRGHFERDY